MYEPGVWESRRPTSDLHPGPVWPEPGPQPDLSSLLPLTKPKIHSPRGSGNPGVAAADKMRV